MWSVEVQQANEWRAVYLVVGRGAATASRRVFRRICEDVRSGRIESVSGRPLGARLVKDENVQDQFTNRRKRAG